MPQAPLTEAVYYILLALKKPLHGYGVMQWVEEVSQGRVCLAAGTLYGALQVLLEKGFIRALPGEKGSRKKEYKITALGEKVLAAEMARLEELLASGKKILRGDAHEEGHL